MGCFIYLYVVYTKNIKNGLNLWRLRYRISDVIWRLDFGFPAINIHKPRCPGAPWCPWGPSPLRPSPSQSLALRPLMGNAKPWEADRFSGAGPAFFDTTGMQRRGRGWWIMSISALKMIHIDSPCSSNKIWCKPVKLSEIDLFLSFPRHAECACRLRNNFADTSAFDWQS